MISTFAVLLEDLPIQAGAYTYSLIFFGLSKKVRVIRYTMLMAMSTTRIT